MPLTFSMLLGVKFNSAGGGRRDHDKRWGGGSKVGGKRGHGWRCETRGWMGRREDAPAIESGIWVVRGLMERWCVGGCVAVFKVERNAVSCQNPL